MVQFLSVRFNSHLFIDSILGNYFVTHHPTLKTGKIHITNTIHKRESRPGILVLLSKDHYERDYNIYL
jgi:hypothetical protein